MRRLVLGTLVTALSSCASMDSGVRSTETLAAQMLVTTEQENSLGLQVKNDLEQNQHVKYLVDPAVQIYVRGVADKVIAFGKKDRPDVVWQVNVIDDPATVNAFATPGGYLYVYSGLLLTASNEAELAGVMAHETGHVVARHSARQLVAQHGLDAVLAMALGKNPGLVAQLASGVVSKGTMLVHSRADETEADEYGARYASLAGYDPRGLTTFFTKLEAQQGSTPKLLSFLSDHPATPDRVAHVNAYIAQHHLGGTELGQSRFLSIRQRIPAVASSTTTTATTPPAPARQPARSGGGAPPPN
ncbi:MAG: M48 family metallopeptidase [Polyangia bacterium]